jgi:hypothetical protein
MPVVKTERAGAFTRTIRSQREGREGLFWFVLSDGENAVQFAYIALPHELSDELTGIAGGFLDGVPVMGMDVGYHAKEPRFPGQMTMQCEDIKSGQCYYDGSSLGAVPVCERWLAAGGGEQWIWDYLELMHRDTFGDTSE